MQIPLCRPFVNDEIKAEVLKVLDSGWLSEGESTRELERAVADYVGVAHAVAVTSCTTGLEVALRCLGLGPGDEVLVPDFTYPATALTVRLIGASPVIVDVDPSTMLMDLDAARRALSPAVKAMMPVSLFGNPMDHAAVAAFKDEAGIMVVEDAACALGAEQGGLCSGAGADLAVFSFHPRKNITTGEGGMIVTPDADKARWMRSYAHYGTDSGGLAVRERAAFVRLGTNLKLSNLAAAVGVVQMRHADELRQRRRDLAARYVELLQDAPGLGFPAPTEDGLHAYQTFCVFVPQRDAIMQALREDGIEAQIGTYALHLQPYFQSGCRIPAEPKGSRWAYDHGLALPLYHELRAEEQEHVAQRLRHHLSLMA